MSIQIRKVSSKKELKTFVRFANRLYKGNKYYVPSMPMDDINTFTPEKNGAFDFSEAELYLAYKGDEVVGRVAAIINHKANEAWKVKQVRFGWIDFIDDLEVSKALLDAVVAFGKARGMEQVVGPLGFTDFDPEGMLVEGFDRLSTMALIYNHPYYPEHMKKHGYTKETGWVEYRITIPEEMPENHIRFSEIIKERYGLKIRKLSRRQIRKEDYGRKIFHLLNEAYSPLFGYSKLSDKQIDSFVKTYLNLVNLRFVTIIHDPDGQLVGVGVTMGSLSRAMQKAKGRLLPFGWYHIIKAMRYKFDDTVEMLLIAVKPEYQGKGVNALLFCDLIPTYNEAGFKWAETAPQLENNMKELNQWDVLNPEYTKRRRCYRKKL